jgi:Zn-dependent protease with chaperone function
MLIPVGFSIWCRNLAVASKNADKAAQWVTYRRVLHILELFTIPAWWSLTNGSIRPHPAASVVLLVPLSCAIFVAHVVNYSSDSRFLGRKWMLSDVFQLATWSTISPPVSLLMLAEGIESARNRSFVGILWMVLAGISALVGNARLQSAEGMKPRAVKSGELYKRSLVLSKRMGIRLQQVCVIPFGRARLTNAYGGWRMIAVTDDYGHWLDGPELDFVIGHELAHVKHKHSLKKLLAAAGIFGLAAALTFILPPPAGSWRVLFNFSVILTPLMVFYLLSRHFEYAADRASLELTGEPEAAIRALSNMYQHAGVPARRSRLQELFSTHPNLSQRLDAIARFGQPSAHRTQSSMG